MWEMFREERDIIVSARMNYKDRYSMTRLYDVVYLSLIRSFYIALYRRGTIVDGLVGSSEDRSMTDSYIGDIYMRIVLVCLIVACFFSLIPKFHYQPLVIICR